MSEFDNYGQEVMPEEEMHDMEMHDEEMLEEGVIAVEPNQLMWGISTSVMFFYGGLIYRWYPKNVKDDNARFPDDDTANNQDEDWALDTEEIKTWTNASTWMMRMYGFGFAAWAANLAIGGDGSRAHQVFYAATQLLTVAPIISIYYALKVQRSYLPNNSVWSFYNLAATNPNDMKYLYDPEVTTISSAYYLDQSAYYNRLFWLIVLSAVNLGVNGATVAGIKRDWQIQNAHWKEMQAAEEEPCVDEEGNEIDCPEEEVAEEVVEEEFQEDNFF